MDNYKYKNKKIKKSNKKVSISGFIQVTIKLLSDLHTILLLNYLSFSIKNSKTLVTCTDHFTYTVTEN